MLVDKDRSPGDPGRAPADPDRVGLTEEWEVRWWCDKFGCSEVTLRKAVGDVGPRASDVERRLRGAAKEVFQNTGED